MKGALAAFFAAILSFAANAQPMAPPEEQLQARPESPFIQRLLASPSRMTTTPQWSRSRPCDKRQRAEARLLERAEQRRLLALIVGDPPARPATFRDAITREAQGPWHWKRRCEESSRASN